MRHTFRHPQDQIDYLEAALRKIAKGEGRFSRDLLTHASNTIADIQAIAEGALAYTWTPPEGEPAQGDLIDAPRRVGV